METETSGVPAPARKMHYSELACGMCPHVVKTKYAIDRQIEMTQHYKKEHGDLASPPQFDDAAWTRQVIFPIYWTQE